MVGGRVKRRLRIHSPLAYFGTYPRSVRRLCGGDSGGHAASDFEDGAAALPRTLSRLAAAGDQGAIIVGSLFWTHSSIEQRNELPDGITRKDGHGNVSVTPRPATSGDSAD